MANTGQMQPGIWVPDLQCNLKVLLQLNHLLHYTSSHLTGDLEICSPHSWTVLLPGCRRAGRATKLWLHLIQCCYIADCPGESILEHRSPTFPEAILELRSLTAKNMQIIHITMLKKQKITATYLFPVNQNTTAF